MQFSRSARLLGLAVCLSLAGCDEPPDRAPVLVLAVDGFEWNVALPLLAEHSMPHLESLMRRGVSGTLRTSSIGRSPVLWTTIASGRTPREHGILDFTREDPDSGEQVLYTSLDRKVKAYWNLLTEYGVSSNTLGWWTTYPAEEVLGTMVSQTNTAGATSRKGALQADAAEQVWPPAYEGRVLDLLREIEVGIEEHMESIFGVLEGRNSPGEGVRWHGCRWAFRADRTYVAVLDELLDTGRTADVTALYLGGADVVGHRFWAAYRPADFDLEPDSREAQRFGHVIPAYYRYVDSVLGELLGRFPPDTTVLVVSDHGMAARPRADLPDRPGFVNSHTGGHTKVLRDGIFVAAGARIRSDGLPAPVEELELAHVGELGRILDFTPTLLALVGVPYAEDMSGRPLATVIDPGFLARNPPLSVPTHDDPEWLARRARGFVHRDAQRLEQLRDLGYLGDPGGDGED